MTQTHQIRYLYTKVSLLFDFETCLHGSPSRGAHPLYDP